MPIYDALCLMVALNIYSVVMNKEPQWQPLAWLEPRKMLPYVWPLQDPSATNLVTGLADAFMDSIPMVAITGQVASSHIGTDAFPRNGCDRYVAFLLKHSYLVTDIDELAPTLAEAFEVAKAGRPGPVIVDIAKDVQLAQAPVDVLPPFTPPSSPQPDEQALVAAQNLLSQCTRPVFYVGGGVQLGKATETVREFLRFKSMPSVSTLKGLGTINRHDPRA